MLNALMGSFVAAAVSYVIARPMLGVLRIAFAFVAGTALGFLSSTTGSIIANSAVDRSTILLGAGLSIIGGLCGTVLARRA